MVGAWGCEARSSSSSSSMTTATGISRTIDDMYYIIYGRTARTYIALATKILRIAG